VQELTILAGHALVSTTIWKERADAGEVGALGGELKDEVELAL
jgi:hypothetical protein